MTGKEKEKKNPKPIIYTKDLTLPRFTVESAEPRETAFVPCTRADLDRVFSIQTERTVNRDNTVKFNNMILQIDKQGWRSSMEGCRVIVYQHFDDSITIGYGHQQLGKYSADGLPIKRSVEKNGRLEQKGRAPFCSKHSNRTYRVLTKPDIFILLLTENTATRHKRETRSPQPYALYQPQS